MVKHVEPANGPSCLKTGYLKTFQTTENHLDSPGTLLEPCNTGVEPGMSGVTPGLHQVSNVINHINPAGTGVHQGSTSKIGIIQGYIGISRGAGATPG